MTATVLVIAGPTGSGKTAAALHVAERWGAEIVSADAMQVYRGMDIGTAKATPEEQERVPHHGIDVVDPHEAFDASHFVSIVDRVRQATDRVIVAGGTSLYIRAAVRGLVPTPPIDVALRRELEAQENLHERLQRADPVLAARLHPNDRVRLVRGLEVYELTGRRLSDLQSEHAAQPDRFPVQAVWLDRDDLDPRLAGRLECMMDAGYVDEVRRLLAEGVSPRAKPMLSLGYRHLCSHLLEALSLEEAMRRTLRDTRRFARKQRTWGRSLGFDVVRSGHVEAVESAALRAFGGLDQ